VFWGTGADRPGWLVRCLDEFARRDINLTKIESRPRRERLGAYMFFADLGGRLCEGPVADAVAAVRSLCQEVRVLGSYRAAVPSRAHADPDG
jgi:prephenate dehydratase